MRITLQYATQVKRAAGVGADTLDAPADAKLPDLLRLAADNRGDALRSMLLDAAGEIQPSLLVFAGDRQIGRDEQITLRDGDVLTVMSPISGG
jgi:molybdopterin converting factor small subunit